METGKKYTLIISVIILLVLCLGLGIAIKHQEIKHWYWWWQYTRAETAEEKFRIFEDFKDDKAVSFLIRILKKTDEDENLRQWAAVVLYDLGQKQTLRALFPHLKGGTEKDFECIYWYLRCRTMDKDDTEYKCTVVGKLYEANAFRILCWMLEDDNWNVRWWATKVLGINRDRRAVEPLIAVLKDNVFDVRCMAIWTLIRIGDKRAIGPLEKALKIEKDPVVRVEIQSAIKKLESLPEENK